MSCKNTTEQGTRNTAIMRFICIFMLMTFVVAPRVSAEVETGAVELKEPASGFKEEVVQSALEGLRSAVDLWKSQEFSALYDWGTIESRGLLSKEEFIRLMKDSSMQLQCCWGALQDLHGFFRSPTQVYVLAKLGYMTFQQTQAGPLEQKDKGADRWIVSSTFSPRTFMMIMQQGRWRIDLTEILLASGHLPEKLRVPTVRIP